MAENSAGTGIGSRIVSTATAFAAWSADFLSKWYGQYFVPSDVASGAEAGAGIAAGEGIGCSLAGILSILIAFIVAAVAALILYYSVFSSPGRRLGDSRSNRAASSGAPEHTYSQSSFPTSTATQEGATSGVSAGTRSRDGRANGFNEGELQAQRLRVLMTGNMAEYERLLQLHRQLYEENHVDPCTSAFFPEGCSQATAGNGKANQSAPPVPPVTTTATPPPPSPGPGQKIKISQNSYQHIVDGHTAGGLESQGNSIFNQGEDIRGLIVQAENVDPTKQSFGNNYERIVDAGRPIGIDRVTGQPTSIYTVITDGSGNLVTAFPGVP